MKMYSTYRLNANELDEKFIDALKTIFKDKEIEIAVYDVDETEYLTRSENNKKKLFDALENVKNNKNLVEINMEDLN
jgi:antitoxin YefM